LVKKPLVSQEMAALFSDVGKPTEDLIKNVFPSESSNRFESEVNSKSSFGSKVQVVVVKKGDAFSSTFKPTYPFTLGETKGELKFQLGTDNKTSIDSSFNLAAVSGLKVKLGTNDTNVNAGFDYTNASFSSNFKLDYPVRSKDAPSLEASSVFVRGNYSFGARLAHSLAGNSAPSVEAKVQAQIGDSSVSLNAKQCPKELCFALAYLHRVSASRTLAAKVAFAPGNGAITDQVGITLVSANQVNDTTLVKARYRSQPGLLAFGISSALCSSSTLELGTEFPANLSGSPYYNVKLIYNF